MSDNPIRRISHYANPDNSPGKKLFPIGGSRHIVHLQKSSSQFVTVVSLCITKISPKFFFGQIPFTSPGKLISPQPVGARYIVPLQKSSPNS
jgi:hypothetical protein